MSKSITKEQIESCLSRIAIFFLQTNQDFTGATATANGEKGMVPEPKAGDQGKYLRGDGTWATPAGTGSAFVISTTQPSDTDVIWIKPT